MLIKTALTLASSAGGRGRLLILIFHRVLPEPDPLMPDEPCIQRFDEVMSWLAEWFTVLPLDQAIERLSKQQLPARAASITFDDGYADNLLHAVPILRKHGLHATFFISTGYLDGGRMWNDTIIESIRGARVSQLEIASLGIGNLSLSNDEAKFAAAHSLINSVKHLPIAKRTEATEAIKECCGAELPSDLMLSSQQVRELHGCGMGIGAHTVTHPILVNLPDVVARQEIADSRDHLESMLGERVTLFAYPNGKLGRDYASSHAVMAKELGFSAAVSTNWGVSSADTDIYQLPRFTPWDRTKWRFGLRTLGNYRTPSSGLS